jgi:hypothetical protein
MEQADEKLLQDLRDAYVAAKQCDAVKCADLLETCLAVVRPAKASKSK